MFVGSLGLQVLQEIYRNLAGYAWFTAQGSMAINAIKIYWNIILCHKKHAPSFPWISTCSSPFWPFAAIFLRCTAEVVRSGGGVFGCSLKTGVIPVGDLPWLWYAVVYLALFVWWLTLFFNMVILHCKLLNCQRVVCVPLDSTGRTIGFLRILDQQGPNMVSIAGGWAPGSISLDGVTRHPKTDGNLAIRVTMTTAGVIVPQNKDRNAIP